MAFHTLLDTHHPRRLILPLLIARFPLRPPLPHRPPLPILYRCPTDDSQS